MKSLIIKSIAFQLCVGIIAVLIPQSAEALPKSAENRAFQKAKGRYDGKFKDRSNFAGPGPFPAETKLPKGKGKAVVNVMLPQAPPFPPADHFHDFKITRAMVRQGGNLVKMRGTLKRVRGGPSGGPGRLVCNVKLNAPKPKFVNSKMAGSGVFGGTGGKLTGKKK